MNGSIRQSKQMRSKARSTRSVRQTAWLAGMLAGLVAGLASAATPPPVEISHNPLTLGSNVPGNLVLTPSVEWPTVNSVANLGGYDVGRGYVGLFDANKCYLYHYEENEANRHFYPESVTSTHQCGGAGQWSGNYLNWATTQTIDPFRIALTGGYRVLDTETETWLEKARHDGQGSGFPNREIDSGVGNATPAQGSRWDELRTRIDGLGNKMYFTRGRDSAEDDLNRVNDPRHLEPYNPNDPDHLTNDRDKSEDNWVYEVSVRVQVCKPGLLEPNCTQYGSNYKPEGLIQQYADRIRYSIFGYLNDHSMYRDGAALRGQQKFVGPFTYVPGQGPQVNTAAEWNALTGILAEDPDDAASAATNTDLGISTIQDSGIINYLNKFGQMTGKDHKSFDPVSEMYYAAVRYLKNQGNVPAYTSISGTSTQKRELADGFPVITDWDDPVAWRCQANVILGIGDVNSHRDKNLPTQSSTSSTDEPDKPDEVKDDDTVDVVTAVEKIDELEPLITLDGQDSSWSGRNNSAYIAGLAYDMHTRDFRPDVAGLQTVSTHWVDVRENQVLLPPQSNQYWLAAKYGGFRVPTGFDPYTRTAALPLAWWHASGDMLNPNSGADVPRPDNYYVASEADKMVEALTLAFARILEEMQGSGASFGASSTQLQTGTTLYQSLYYSNTWRGDLTAYQLNPATGNINATADWRAGSVLLARDLATDPRDIYTASSGSLISFEWNNLTGTEKSALGDEIVVDYLRGDRSQEFPSGALRLREGILGDIVDSQPVYVGAPPSGLFQGASFTGATAYSAFVTAQAGRDPAVYVGANDGMLHAFDAATGEEKFAYVPEAAITDDLRTYAYPGYEHKYSVDGELTIANVYISGEWKTVLVGTMGRGNPGVFALDVTNPDSPSLLWDKTATDIPQLGNNLGKPIIAQVADSDWRVVFGNGPNSSTGGAHLISIGLASGTVSTVDLGGGTDNGMTAAVIWDSNSDKFFDRAYAGDFDGNMWRIDGLATTTPTSIKMIAATDGTIAQPITAAPLVATRPNTLETWVFFGTGRYLGEGDLSNTDEQSWYGIQDTGATLTRANLEERSITAETTTVTGGPLGRAIEAAVTGDMSGKSGWYIDLVSPTSGAEGERMVVPNIFLGLALVGVTRIPNTTDVCSPGGRSWVMAIEPFSGAALSQPYFDMDNDGDVDADDVVGTAADAPVSSGLGLVTGSSGLITVGNRLYGTLDSGGHFTPPPPPASTQVSRVSWREVVND